MTGTRKAILAALLLPSCVVVEARVAPAPDWSPDVTYHTTVDGRVIADRRPDCRAFVFGDNRMGRVPRGMTSDRFYQYDDVIVEAAKTYGIDPVFLKAILEVESGFRQRVVSRAGAMGIGQIMPGTARLLGVKNPFDPVEAIWGSAAHLRRTADAFKTQNMVILASGYNAGDKAVSRTLARVSRTTRHPDLLSLVPTNKETPGYVKKVLWTWDRIHRGR